MKAVNVITGRGLPLKRSVQAWKLPGSSSQKP